MGVLYAEGGRIMCKEYIEIYIPQEYFDSGVAQNHGSSMETLGVLYIRTFKNGVPEDVKLLNIPVISEFMVYSKHTDTIQVHGSNVECVALEYPAGSYILHQTLPKGREIANTFLNSVLGGKLPRTLNYNQLMNIWWKNLQISGISYKVPSKIFEMIIASIYRNPSNVKERYGQLYGRQANPNGYDYTTENVRQVVKDLSTFSGMIFEDIGTMITSGINNANQGIEEQESPLEKIIHY